jgi:hypothetical protein
MRRYPLFVIRQRLPALFWRSLHPIPVQNVRLPNVHRVRDSSVYHYEGPASPVGRVPDPSKWSTTPLNFPTGSLTTPSQSPDQSIQPCV